MGCKRLSESLRDKSIMAQLLEGTHFIPKTIKVTQAEPKFEEVEWKKRSMSTHGNG